MIDNPCGAKRKRAELWTAVSGLLALISRAYCTLSPGIRYCVNNSLLILTVWASYLCLHEVVMLAAVRGEETRETTAVFTQCYDGRTLLV